MFRMSDDLYDMLKKIAQIWIPFVATVYAGLAKIWGWPYGVEIVGSLSVIDTALGMVLGISTQTFIKDQIKKVQ